MKRCTAHTHAPGCRPARPLCRWRRKLTPYRAPCYCGARHYPHRAGEHRGGRLDAAANALAWGPSR